MRRSSKSSLVESDGETFTKPMRRRSFLRMTATGCVAFSVASQLRSASTPDSIGVEAFDREVEAFMAARKIPGGALAVARHGRLVHAKGFGWADRTAKILVEPRSLFRIA